MRKPTIRSGTVPMFYIRCYFNDITGKQTTCCLTPFLIISYASNGYQDLSACMAVPIVSATRFKSNIEHRDIQVFVTGQRRQPGFSRKVLFESCIFLSYRKCAEVLRYFFFFHILCIYRLHQNLQNSDDCYKNKK